jgi:hypothetical protein
MENFLLFGGFAILLVGLILGFVTVYKMLNVINKDRSPQDRFSEWQIFVGIYSADITQTYRKSHKGEPLNKLYGSVWILLGFGFLMVIGSYFAGH